MLWLAPTPEQPLRQLTAAVWAAFPDHPPYSGAHGTASDALQPHPSIAECALAGPRALQATEADVHLRLPVACRSASTSSTPC